MGRTLGLIIRAQVRLARNHKATNRSTGRAHKKQSTTEVVSSLSYNTGSDKKLQTTPQLWLKAGHQMLPSFNAVSVPLNMTAPLGGPTTRTPFSILMAPGLKTKKNKTILSLLKMTRPSRSKKNKEKTLGFIIRTQIQLVRKNKNILPLFKINRPSRSKNK